MTEQLVDYDIRLTEKKGALIHALAPLGVDFPFLPRAKDDIGGPRDWLIRGESSSARIFNQDPFLPTSGAMGTKGVFFGDCASALMYPDPGVYYVIKREQIDAPWLVYPSGEYDQEMDAVARKHGLNLKKIGDGVEAEEFVYQARPVYQKEQGICSVNRPVPLEDVSYILLTEYVYAHIDVSKLSPDMQKKIVRFRF